MTWNCLKREKNTLLRYIISRFCTSRGLCRYDVASLTCYIVDIFSARPMQFGILLEAPIVYRLHKTVLEYCHCLPRYGKPNMLKYCDISPFSKYWTFSVGGIFRHRPLKFGTFVEVHIVYRLQKTVQEYLHYLPRYSTPNIIKYCDISSCTVNFQSPYLEKKFSDFSINWHIVRGHGVLYCLRV